MTSDISPWSIRVIKLEKRVTATARAFDPEIRFIRVFSITLDASVMKTMTGDGGDFQIVGMVVAFVVIAMMHYFTRQ